MKNIGNIYQYNGKTITIESFYGKEQAVAVCRYVNPEYSDSPSGWYKYEKVGPSFELTKADLLSAKRMNSDCDNCVFYRTSMHNNDANYSRAWCAYGTTVSQNACFSVDCTKHKTEKDIKKVEISTKKAKEVFNRHFKDCRLVCGSDIESNNKAIMIESVSEFKGLIAERLMNKKRFDSLLKKVTGNVVVIENFPVLLSKSQCVNYTPYHSLLKSYEMDVKALDYDIYVYFCSEFPDIAFLFDDWDIGVYTLHELTFQIKI